MWQYVITWTPQQATGAFCSLLGRHVPAISGKIYRWVSALALVGYQEGEVDNVDIGVLADLGQVDLAIFCGLAPVHGNIVVRLRVELAA